MTTELPRDYVCCRYVGGRYGGCSERAMMEEIYYKGPIAVGFQVEISARSHVRSHEMSRDVERAMMEEIYHKGPIAVGFQAPLPPSPHPSSIYLMNCLIT